MSAQKAETGESTVRRQTVKYIHRDIHNRYRIDSIRKLAGAEADTLLAGIGQEEIDQLEQLFRGTIYPEVDARAERDKSFESLIAMLKNPTRLTRIIPSMPGLIIKYASIWPSAFNTGISAMLAYLDSVHIENKIVAETISLVQERGEPLSDKVKISYETYREACSLVPIGDSRKMIAHAIKSMRAGKNRRLTSATLNILGDVRNTFLHQDSLRIESGQQPMYTDTVHALNFGVETLKNIQHVFGLYPPEKMDRLMEITRIVELAFLDCVHGISSNPASCDIGDGD